MSSVQSRTLTINDDNYSTYGSGYWTSINDENWNYFTLNSAAKNALYPNSYAHPIKGDISGTFAKDWYISGGTVDFVLQFSGTNVLSGSGTGSDDHTVSISASTLSAIIESTRNTEIRSGLHGNRKGFTKRTRSLSFTLYFTRYDFSATSGTGIASASVSSGIGYDSDSITFTASIQSGYAFDGWYNGTTKISSSQTYVHTVNGADLSLTAKAIVSAKQLTVTYGDNIIIDKQVIPPVSITYDNTQIASVASGQTKTLNCSNKLISSNIIISGGGGALSSVLKKLWGRISQWLSANPKGGELM